MMREWLEYETDDICKELGITSTNCFVMLFQGAHAPARVSGDGMVWWRRVDETKLDSDSVQPRAPIAVGAHGPSDQSRAERVASVAAPAHLRCVFAV